MGGKKPARKSVGGGKGNENSAPTRKFKSISAPAPEYFVERIIQRKEEKGKISYLVKWQGWPSTRNTWEPESGLIDTCQEMIDEFNEHNQILQDYNVLPALDTLGIEESATKGKTKRKSEDAKQTAIDSEAGAAGGDADKTENGNFKVPAVPGKSGQSSEASQDSGIGQNTDNTDDIALDLNCLDILKEFPKSWKPRCVRTIIPMGTALVYDIELDTDDEEDTRILVLANSFKLLYPELVISYYQKRLDWVRDPGLAIETPVEVPDSPAEPIASTSRGTRAAVL